MICHIATVALFCGSLAFGVIFYGERILPRTWQSLVDFFNSFVYFVAPLFGGEWAPTVQEIPGNMENVLPMTLSEFEIKWARFWSLFTQWEHWQAYLLSLLSVIVGIVYWCFVLLLPLSLLALIVYLIYRRIDNDHNVDTKPMKIFKFFRRLIFLPVKRVLIAYGSFLKERKAYIVIAVIVWVFNLNFLTIAFELVAYVFYLFGSADFINALVQVAKLAADLTVAITVIPTWGWWLGAYWLFHLWRRKLGKISRRLKLAIDEAFAEKYTGAIFLTGKQRCGKSTMLAMLKFICERLFRKKAKEKFSVRDKQFPFFPWINVARFVQKARDEHKIFMLYHCRKFARLLRKIYEMPEGEKKEKARERLKQKYGYDFKTLLFDYDESYGLSFDNRSSIVSVFDAIEAYMQLFFIYSQRKPLDFATTPLREDFDFIDFGNMPIFDGELLDRTSQESFELSQYSFVLDYDAFRPGAVFDHQNEYRYAVEYGIGFVPEFAKERKNNITRKGGVANESAEREKKNKPPKGATAGEAETKEKKLPIATQGNDYFELDTKVRGQVATIDNYDFWKWLFDDQRAGSLGADNKDLTTNGYIKGRSDDILLMPFFEVEEAIYQIITPIYDKIKDFFDSRHGSNTLFLHVIKILYQPLFQFHERIHQEFDARKIRVKMKDPGDNDAELGEETFWLLSFVTYRGRIATDACKVFYDYRFEQSEKGMEDCEQYDGLYATTEKMLKQHSYYVEDMMTFSGLEVRRSNDEK